MKLRTLALVLVCWSVVLSQSIGAEPLGTAFTYQGRLHDQGAPANGLYDLRFILYNAEFGGSQIGNVLTNAGLFVGNGLFTTMLDFALGPFDGQAYWLEVAVRTNTSAMGFIPLHPRQRLMPTPYALHALNAGFAVEAANASNALTAASVPWTGITGVPAGFSNTIYTAGVGLSLSPGNEFSVIFDGSGMSNAAARSDHTHDAADLVSGVLLDARLSGEYTALLQFSNPSNRFSGGFQGDGGDLTNLMAAHLVGTLLDSQLSTNVPRLDANQTFVGAVGFSPASGAPFAVGSSQTVSNLSADLLDGLDSASFWRTGGNAGTLAGTDFLGTTDNQPLELKVNNTRALRLEPTIGAPNILLGGIANSVVQGTLGGTVVGGAIGGGSSNSINAAAGRLYDCTIAGGTLNQIIWPGSPFDHVMRGITISGGYGNQVTAITSPNVSAATIGGGGNNGISGDQRGGNSATISGGSGNDIHGSDSAAIGGGAGNTISHSPGSTIGGGGGNSIVGSFTLSADSSSTIAGGYGNRILPNVAGTIGGGGANTVAGSHATVCGGQANTILSSADHATIGGGQSNAVLATHATIPGGLNNLANGRCSFAAGHRANALHDGAFVWTDSMDADFASTGSNQFLIRASGGVGIGTTAPQTALHVSSDKQAFVTIDGGPGQEAGIALGTNGVAKWYLYTDDTNAADFQIIATGLAGEDENSPRLRLPDENKNVLLALSGGRVGIGTNSPGASLDVIGEVRATTLTPVSDRAAKEHFQPVDGLAVLEKLTALPIESWNFRCHPSTRHLGPMAQDFHAAFGLGADDKHISTVDADGVALAAIQGLNSKLEQELKQKTREIQSLKQNVAELAELTKKLAVQAGLLDTKSSQAGVGSP